MKKESRSIILLLLLAIAATLVAGSDAECDLACALEEEADDCGLFCVSCTGCTLSMVTPAQEVIAGPEPSLRSTPGEPLTTVCLRSLDILHVPRLV